MDGMREFQREGNGFPDGHWACWHAVEPTGANTYCVISDDGRGAAITEEEIYYCVFGDEVDKPPARARPHAENRARQLLETTHIKWMDDSRDIGTAARMLVMEYLVYLPADVLPAWSEL